MEQIDRARPLNLLPSVHVAAALPPASPPPHGNRPGVLQVSEKWTTYYITRETNDGSTFDEHALLQPPDDLARHSDDASVAASVASTLILIMWDGRASVLLR